MILIGLQNCEPCMEMHKKHPNVSFVEIPRHVCNADKDLYKIKTAIGRFGINEFPVLMNDSLTKVLPMNILEIG